MQLAMGCDPAGTEINVITMVSHNLRLTSLLIMFSFLLDGGTIKSLQYHLIINPNFDVCCCCEFGSGSLSSLLAARTLILNKTIVQDSTVHDVF